MPDDDIPDDLLFGDMAPDPEQQARLKRSMPFEIADLPAIDHGNLMRPLSIGEGFSISTVSGDTLRLEDIFQYRTYAGVLNGIPFDPASHIEGDLRYVASIFPNHQAPPCVVPPLMHKGRRILKREGVEEVEDWCILPTCTSFGSFKASRLGRTASADDDGSSVLLVWYQDKFGLPVDAHILKFIAEFDWDLYAHHWSY
jgi:hypothetical protein